MVSFSCEASPVLPQTPSALTDRQGCGDVLTKKKLDVHRGQCRGASFTCLDCMTHFHGADYRAHTSCVSEAQKYQGALYRPDRERRPKTKSSARRSPSVVPRPAYVEDAPDPDSGPATGSGIGIVDPPPPRAPSPPPPAGPVNVFDFLVSAQTTPNASSTALVPQEPTRPVIERASPPPQRLPAFEDERGLAPAGRGLRDLAAANASRETFGESGYGENGFHYGDGPVPTAHAGDLTLYQTPAPRRERERRRRDDDSGRREHKKDNKRKRVHIDDLDLSAARRPGGEGDEMMIDAPPELHTGLTGGLNRLLSTGRPADFPPSPDFSGGDGASGASPGSPLKRSKHARAAARHGAALVPTRRPSSSARDGVRVRKGHRKHRHREASERERERPSAAPKAIEYHTTDLSSAGAQRQLVLYRTRAELFMSFVNKGPDSEKGCSINKALKRYHRERGDVGVGLGKGEEEKELWKSLRLRKNERGETVLFF